MSGLKIINPVIAVYSKALREVLDTHINLNDTHKKYAINTISNILNSLINPKILENNSFLTDKNISFLENFNLQNAYYKFLLYSNLETNTGKYCMTYNELLDDAIIKKDNSLLNNFIKEFKHILFFEFYDNKHLDDVERKTIESTLDIEFNAIQNTLNYAIINEDIKPNFLVGYDNLYQKQLSSFKFDKTILFNDDIIKITDIYQENKIPYIFKFKSFDILSILAFENKNPDTLEAFTISVYDNLLIKYSKEIKMIKRYFKGKGKK